LLKQWEFSFLEVSKSGREIDLIIEKPRSKPILVEIKSFSKFSIDKVSQYISLAKEIPHDVAYVLSNDPSSFETQGIRCLHWQTGLKEIFDL
jgi:hypothetical protein